MDDATEDLVDSINITSNNVTSETKKEMKSRLIVLEQANHLYCAQLEEADRKGMHLKNELMQMKDKMREIHNQVSVKYDNAEVL